MDPGQPPELSSLLASVNFSLRVSISPANSSSAAVIRGGKAVEIGPWIGDLKKAGGAMATLKGPVHVDWKITGKTLHINIAAPEHIKVVFKSNASHDGLDIAVGG
jgi:hypothetical protein